MQAVARKWAGSLCVCSCCKDGYCFVPHKRQMIYYYFSRCRQVSKMATVPMSLAVPHITFPMDQSSEGVSVVDWIY